MPQEPPTEQESHAAFLGALKALGGSAGNGRLRELLEWDEATYQQVKASLEASRAVIPGRGRGGSVALASSNGAECQAQEPMPAGPSTANGAGVAASSPAKGSTGVTTYEAGPATSAPAQPPAGAPAAFTPSRWIAPPEKDAAKSALEKNLWDAADQFRANSGLKAQEYSGPILGLIFLRFAEVRFLARRAVLAEAEASSRRGSRLEEPGAYHADGVLYLAEQARFAWLLERPEGADIGALVNAAMRLVEQHNSQLAGVLPKTYNLFTGTLLKQLLKTISEIPASLEFDAFGRIYEYFLGAFAMSEGQGGGEFYTPSSIVTLLTEVIEPFHGRILDPACGSGGMFVQSARFVSEHHQNPAAELAICGVEKTDETGRLARLNLAVHGLEGDIRHGDNVNSYYDDPHNATGAFDFVLANPPFNVNAVDKERLKDMVGAGRRFPFGLPRTDNANYLWIQLFYSALNTEGRAGFVMANSASDARSSEQELRQKLIEARAVDVMVAVGPNMFYTVTLPCTLWFLDRGKAKTQRADTVLFIDARHIYRQIDRAHRDWTPAQIGFLANLVRLYRGEAPDLTVGGEETAARLKDVFGEQPVYSDIPGLCKAAAIEEIEAQGWSLNPGRYVGVAQGEELSDEDFKAQLETLNEELEVLNAQARGLEQTIAANVASILER
jgi:type I restriction enzyme M protein